jgi:hypothetical protein
MGEPRDVVERLGKWRSDIAKMQSQYAVAAAMDRTPGEYHVPADDVVALVRAASVVMGAAADEIEALRAEVERLRALVDWQKIETAPKDGTEVLITGIGFRGRRWMSVAKQINGRWYDDSKHAGNLTNVTHWQPLPEPPTP